MSNNTKDVDTFTEPSFSFYNRVYRVIWGIVCFLVFRYTPNYLFSWRGFILSLFGAKIGKGVHIYPKVRIWAPYNIEIGNQSGIANDVNLYSQGKIKIGERSIVSQGSYICTGTHDYSKRGHPLVCYDIMIGNNVWIAAEVFVHPGITIGDGAVIGARSVVTRDISEWTVCAGNPCVFLKYRRFID